MGIRFAGRSIEVIGFDADDTLWHNEPHYQESQNELVSLLAGHATEDRIRSLLLDVERRNLSQYGYGVKSFVLSMIETASELTGGRITGVSVDRILSMGKQMLSASVDPLPGASETLRLLSESVPLFLITKGDLRDQEEKLAKSGLKSHFTCVEIVSEKTPEVYGEILEAHSIAPHEFLMVGNSPRSDVDPILSLGGLAVLIPYHVLWEHEQSSSPGRDSQRAAIVVDCLADLPGLLGVG